MDLSLRRFADDLLWWVFAPGDLFNQRGLRVPGWAHVCPFAILIARVPRESLDPMALGTCRYCGSPLEPIFNEFRIWPATRWSPK